MSDIAAAIDLAAANTPTHRKQAVIDFVDSIAAGDWREIACAINRYDGPIGLVPLKEAIRVMYHILTDGHHKTDRAWILHPRQPIIGMIRYLRDNESPGSPYVQPALDRVLASLEASGIPETEWQRVFWPAE